MPVTFSGRVGDGVGDGVGGGVGGGGGDGGAGGGVGDGVGDGVDREGGRSGSGSGRTTTARDRVSREGDRATGADVRGVVVVVVVVVYNPTVASRSRFKKRPVSRRGKLAPVPRVPPSAVLRFRRSVRLARSFALSGVSFARTRARATSSARHHGRLTSLSLAGALSLSLSPRPAMDSSSFLSKGTSSRSISPCVSSLRSSCFLS